MTSGRFPAITPRAKAHWRRAITANVESKADKSQGRFYDALRELFVGAKVEGQSGFINLMRIKSRYYTDGVFPRQQEDIEAARLPAGR